MLIQYDKKTGKPWHVIFSCPPEMEQDLLRGGALVYHEHASIHEIEIVHESGLHHARKTDEVAPNGRIRGLSAGTITLNSVEHQVSGDIDLPPLGEDDGDVTHVRLSVPKAHDGSDVLKFRVRKGETWEVYVPALAPCVRRRQPLPLTFPKTCKVGEEIKISLPEGVDIQIGDSHMGVMDASGVLEFTPQVGGVYKFKFSGSGWITQEITIEALP